MQSLLNRALESFCLRISFSAFSIPVEVHSILLLLLLSCVFLSLTALNCIGFLGTVNTI